MSNAIEINSGNYESEVLQAQVPVLVDFGASWCGPCQKIAPIIDELAAEFQGRAKVVAVDVDNNQALAGQYGIMSVPTLMIIKNGDVVQKWVGFTQKQILSDALNAAIAD
ncbi:MAG: thioredoxin [bacterium]|jgi:thioredoxin 1|nr:thioredoxin [bacterium]